MIANFTAIIGAKIKDFQRKMKMVDKKVKETAMEATKPINADINDFYASILEVESLTAKAVKKAEKEITVDLNDFYIQMAAMEAETKLVLKKDEKTIGADISDFLRKAAQVAVVARSLAQSKIIISVEARIKKFQATIGRIAQTTRAFGELAQTTFQGIGTALAPAIVPLIASLAGLIGQLGPMVGVLAGSTFALGSAFGVAGAGAAAFTSIAVSNLKDVFTASSDIKKIQEKLAMETDDKKKAELLDKMARIQGSLNKEQSKAYQVMGKLQSVWNSITKSLEKPTIKIFTDFLVIMAGALERLKPLFEGSVKAVQSLTTSLGNAMKGERMTAFFEYLNTNAGPILETIGKSFGNFIQGIFSMVTAFSGLTSDTSKGFLAMSESFATWAAGLGESKKFRSFVDYVKENMPKIRSIFSDAFQGIINVFAGFAPSSANMMSGLQDMMERFKEWSSTMSLNKGFQNFIDYVKENGPKAVSFIGNLVTSIVNIGIALAPMGAKVLELVNGFMSWMNSLMETNPLLGKVVAWVLVITGVLLALAPNIIAMGTLFAGAGSLIGGAMSLIMARTALMRAKFVTGMAMMVSSMLKAGAQMVLTAARMVAQWVIMGVQSLLQAGRMAAAWFIAMGPIGWVIGAIVGLAILIIANWDKISAWTSKAWSATSKFVVGAIAKIVGWVQEKFPAIFNIISAYMESAKNIIKAVWDYVKGTFSNVLAFIRALVKGDFQGMKDAIANQMELAKNTISKIWDTVNSYFATVLGEIVGKVSDKFGEMPGVILSFVDKMKQAGADLIAGVIKGITGKIGEGLDAIGGFAKGLLARFKKDTDTHSPSRAFANISKWFAPGIVKGIDKTSHLAVNSISSLATDLSNAFNPKLAMADMQANATLNTSVSRADMNAVQHSFAADLGALDINQPDTILMMDGKEVGRITAKHVAEENNRYEEMVKVARGGRQ